MPDAPPATGPAADAARAFRHAIDQDCAERGWTYQQLIGRTSYGEHHILAIVEARQRPTRKVAAALDVAFGTGERYYRMWEAFDQARRAQQTTPVARAGTIAPLEIGGREVMEVPTRREMLGWVGVGMAAGLVEALDASRQAGASSLAPGTIDQLHQAIDDYATRFPTTPADDLHAEVLPVRRWVGSLMHGKLTLGEHRDLIVSAGWLSVLLALLAFDRGECAAMQAWCDDGRDCGIEAGQLELAATSREILASNAFYAGQPAQAVTAAREGLALAPQGSGIEYKLAAQEMRALAALGDRDGFADVRRRVEATYTKLPAAPHSRGKLFVVNTTLDHPHMLGAAMVLLADWPEAERLKSDQLTGEPEHDAPGRSISYLERGIARAHLGRLDEAADDGACALRSQRPARAVLVQAGKLDRTLVEADAALPEVRAFHERYRESRKALTGRAPA